MDAEKHCCCALLLRLKDSSFEGLYRVDLSHSFVCSMQ